MDGMHGFHFMTSTGGFRTTEEEVSRMLDELAVLRELLREISGRLSRLEMRAKRAFPAVVVTRKETKRANNGRNLLPQITAAEALQIYDHVVEEARAGEHKKATDLLEQLPLPDLLLLHKEVGLTRSESKPSRKAIISSLLVSVR